MDRSFVLLRIACEHASAQSPARLRAVFCNLLQFLSLSLLFSSLLLSSLVVSRLYSLLYPHHVPISPSCPNIKLRDLDHEGAWRHAVPGPREDLRLHAVDLEIVRQALHHCVRRVGYIAGLDE